MDYKQLSTSKASKKIVVCGCGWLGLPLAKQLIARGHHVTGTKRDIVAANALTSHGIVGVPFSLDSSIDSTASFHGKQALFEADSLILNIPPGRRTIDRDQFVTSMKTFIDEAKAHNVGQLIFISTTSVYGELKGKITEETPTNPTTESGKAHVEIERYVRAQFDESGIVLRLSGLVGEERHPAKFLAGREDIANGQDPVNLVHRDDCVTAIQNMIEQKIAGGLYHLCAAEHPAREAFYQWAATEMDLPLPHFLESDGMGKQIDASETVKALSLVLKYPSPFDMPLPKAK